jgi:hypothetical protein
MEMSQTPVDQPSNGHPSTATSIDHAVMDHSAMGHAMAMPRSFAEGSGTARLPGNEAMNHGLHLDVGGGDTLMLHGYVWGV